MNRNDDNIADRIATARQEAESLKERIKQKKETLADTTCNRVERTTSFAPPNLTLRF